LPGHIVRTAIVIAAAATGLASCGGSSGQQGSSVLVGRPVLSAASGVLRFEQGSHVHSLVLGKPTFVAQSDDRSLVVAVYSNRNRSAVRREYLGHTTLNGGRSETLAGSPNHRGTVWVAYLGCGRDSDPYSVTYPSQTSPMCTGLQHPVLTGLLLMRPAPGRGLIVVVTKSQGTELRRPAIGDVVGGIVSELTQLGNSAERLLESVSQRHQASH
jgi:hypothetical protein